jgi:protein SCO1/2
MGMGILRNRILALALACAWSASAAAGSAAPAPERLHGLVLQVDVAHATAVVRHDPIGTMPGMTMTFQVSHAAAERLRAGENIDAWLDMRTDPWTLRDVRASTVVTQPNVSLTRHVQPLREGDLLPSTRFVDQLGRPFDLASLRGQAVVLSFIFTRCQDPRMCPLISSDFHALQERLRGGPFHLVEVTLDPVYDRPPVLAKYGRTFGADPARWSIVTGDPAAVLDFAARFSVTAFPDERAGLIHTDRTVITDRDGRIREFIDETGWLPDQVATAARGYAGLGTGVNPLRRFDLWLSEQAVAVCGNSVAGFSGLADLAIVLAVFGALGWVLFRLARMFARGA